MKKHTLAVLLISASILSACGSSVTPTPEREAPVIQDPIDQQLYNAAISTLDAELCEELSDPELAKTCDFEIQDLGVFELAKTDLDVGKCEAIGDKRIRALCMKEVQGLVEAQNLSDIEQEKREESLNQADEARSSNDVSKCDSIAEEATKSDCINNFYHNKALQENNPVLCDKLTSEEEAEICRSTFSEEE